MSKFFDWLRLSEIAALTRTTTFRVTAQQTLISAFFVAVVMAMVYFETVGEFERTAENDVRAQFAEVIEIYNASGLRRVSQDMIERSTAPGPWMYMLTEPTGAVIVGEFSRLPRGDITERPEPVEFPTQVERDNGDMADVRVRGVIGRLGVGGPILMIVRDMSAQDAAVGRILRLLLFGLGFGLLVSVAIGVMAGRRAARRVEALSQTMREVRAGDLSRRAEIADGDDEINLFAEELNAVLDWNERLVLQARTTGDALAHDLRSPLTRARSQIEHALDQPPNPERDRAALEKTLAESETLLAMFRGIMDISRADGLDTRKFEALDISPIVEQVAEDYGPVVEDSGHAFSCAIQPGLTVRGDRHLLLRAMTNLLENAIKYTPEGGAISLEARRRADGQIEVLIEDDGPGVPADKRHYVFERFKRLDATRLSPGIGLGLSLVEAIAKAHRGRAELRDGRRPGPGSDRPGLGAALILPSLSAS